MARHSNGLKNYAIAPSIFAAVIVLALILVGGVWWLMKRDQANQQHEASDSSCIEGEVKLPVSSASTAVLQQLVTDYAASKPVVKDHCVKIEHVQDIKDAALVFLSGDVPLRPKTLGQNARPHRAVRQPANGRGRSRKDIAGQRVSHDIYA